MSDYVVIDESGHEHTDPVESLDEARRLADEHEDAYDGTFYAKEVGQ
jgi:hypothetical protein